MNPSASLTCPRCGLSEPIQKVSVLYEGNTKEWQETTGSGRHRHTVTRQAKTLLGQRLSPPAQPNAGINPAVWWWGGIGLLAFIGLTFGVPLCLGVFMAGVGVLASLAGGAVAVDPSLLNSWSQWQVPSWVWLVSLACLGALLLVGGLLTWRIGAWIKVKYSASQAAYRQRVAATASDRLRWERAMERWNALYYCTRDDVIFVPGQRAVPSQDLPTYIYE